MDKMTSVIACFLARAIGKYFLTGPLGHIVFLDRVGQTLMGGGQPLPEVGSPKCWAALEFGVGVSQFQHREKLSEHSGMTN